MRSGTRNGEVKVMSMAVQILEKVANVRNPDTHGVQMVRQIASNVLQPHLDNLEFQLRPGMVTLPWTSMNIK